MVHNGDAWSELWQRHRWKITLSLVGLLVAVMIRLFGLGWTLFVLLLMAVGYWLGRQLDDSGQSPRDLIDRFSRRL